MHSNILPEDSILGISTKTETINPQWLSNDRIHYQRNIIQDNVEKFLGLKHKELSERVGLAGKRADGSYWTIDGQHHTEASVRKGIDLMMYRVFESSGHEHEKEVFDKFQEWKAKNRQES